MTSGARFAGVELGGTKAIAVLALGGTIVERRVVPTTEPAATLGALRETLGEWQAQELLAGLGIASLGPIQLDPQHPDFGQILATPVATTLTEGLACPWAIDTDVNGAALAEYRGGRGRAATACATSPSGPG